MNFYNSHLLLALLCLTFFKFISGVDGSEDAKMGTPMSDRERIALREEARDMFYHAYRAYMENAYPADELMPLSCQGRFRGLTASRGDIDDSLGNYSLTLIDTLDTLVILGDFEEFEHATKLVIRDVSFDSDIIVSVFEANIRVLGGLLSGHVLAEYLKQQTDFMQWYKGELLDMAKDIGYRLLPAFNTTTGIPHARVNLKHGIKSNRLDSAKETCTACAGSVILEMAALSRLTGEPIFERKAHHAMDELWKMRHRSSDLMGTVLNVHSGDWVRRDSGVGAGIDSYYEYCLKAYILLGEDRYLNRFNRHYSAVMKYISQGPMLLDVHMHRPHTNSRNFMDALLAFWPGLQVLKGDIKPAVETHEMLYQVMQRHKFIPEAFTTDFQVHWGNHPLRPEFLESTYFLYSATNDPYYLEVGKNVLRSLQKYARVPCGYAAVNDVRTGKKEDRMDSFVLAETFKYLYLLFADRDDLLLDMDEFIFTTEGHLLPLTLGRFGGNASYNHPKEELEEYEYANICPNTFQLFPESVRKPLHNMVDGMCPRRLSKRRLTASEFSASNVNHLKIIKDMGINIIALNDGRVQLLHTFGGARTTADAEEGLLFMQEMIELTKLQSQQPDASPQAVSFTTPSPDGLRKLITLQAGPSHFGANLKGSSKVTGKVIIIHPSRGCGEMVTPTEHIEGKIALMERGDCMFVEKARRVQRLGAIGAIVIDNTPESSADASPMFSMSGDGTDDVRIPTVFLFAREASKLLLTLSKEPNTEVTISELKVQATEAAEVDTKELGESIFQRFKVSVQEFLNKHTGWEFSDVVAVGNFKAYINGDKIKIAHVKNVIDGCRASEINTSYKEKKPVDRIRLKLLLKKIFGNDLHEHILFSNVFHRVSDIKPSNKIKDDVVWLIKELNTEVCRRDDHDEIVKSQSESSYVANNAKGTADIDEMHLALQTNILTLIENLNKIDEANRADDLVVTSGGENDESNSFPSKKEAESTGTLIEESESAVDNSSKDEL